MSGAPASGGIPIVHGLVAFKTQQRGIYTLDDGTQTVRTLSTFDGSKLRIHYTSINSNQRFIVKVTYVKATTLAETPGAQLIRNRVLPVVETVAPPTPLKEAVEAPETPVKKAKKPKTPRPKKP